MKKITKILPLVLFPSLIMVACNKANDTNKDAIVNNDNGITELNVEVDLNGGTFEGQTSFIKKVRKGTYYEYFRSGLPTGEQITYPGHTFKFYSLDGQTEEIQDTYRFLNEPIKIVAQYDADDPHTTVTWKNYDGSTLATKGYYIGEMPTYDGTPTRPSEFGKVYTFTGWDPEPEEIVEDTPATVTYTAQYTAEVTECVVSFDSKGGTAVAPILVKKDGTIENAPTNPTREGYVFDKPENKSGWFYKDATDQEQEFVFGNAETTGVTHITSDMTLYCKWNKGSFNATFNPNGGKWTDAEEGHEEDSKEVLTELDKIPEDPQASLEYTGHTFKGWQRSDGNIGLIPMVAGGVTYTAQWITLPTEYSIDPGTYDHGEVTVSQTVATAGTKITGTVTPYDATAYYCSDIACDDPTTLIDYKAGEKYFTFTMPAKAIKLTATFTAVPVAPSITIVTVTGGQVSTNPAGSAVTGTTVTGTVTPDNNKICTSIAAETEDGSVDVNYTAGEKFFTFTMPSKNITITPTFETAPTTEYLVQFDTKGGTFVPAKTVADGGTIETAPTSTRPGYTFVYWFYYDTMYNEIEFIFADDSSGRDATTVTSDMILNAKWEVEAAQTATFNYINNTTDITPNAVTVHTDDTNTDTLTSGGTAKSITFKRSYLSFDYQLAASEPELTTSRIVITISSTDVGSDKIHVESTGTGTYSITLDSSVTIPAGGYFTLLVKNPPVLYTLTANPNNGVDEPYEVGTFGPTDIPTVPATPTAPADRDFVSWYNNYTKFDFTKPLTANTTITAHWGVHMNMEYTNDLLTSEASTFDGTKVAEPGDDEPGRYKLHAGEDKDIFVDFYEGNPISGVLNITSAELPDWVEAGWPNITSGQQEVKDFVELILGDTPLDAADYNATYYPTEDLEYPNVTITLTNSGYEKISNNCSLTIHVHSNE